ncbi:hypothetical protein [Domibacillus indicus]|uniref:hypothetical protein n=1 Tax=Domibacillus indicus TaxID=1437523 RepID=UPI0018CCFEB8|nr:hypothetical protein [Domibacillus indicus]
MGRNAKQETSKTSKQKAEQKQKGPSGQMDSKPAEQPRPAAVSTGRKQLKPPENSEKLSPSARTNRMKKEEPASVIDTWTGEDMIKGIVLSEILGPPKSKRKK